MIISFILKNEDVFNSKGKWPVWGISSAIERIRYGCKIRSEINTAREISRLTREEKMERVAKGIFHTEEFLKLENADKSLCEANWQNTSH